MDIKDILQILGYIVAMGGFLWGLIKPWMMKKYQLSAGTKAVLDALEKAGITTDNIGNLISTASAFVDKNKVEKQQWVSDQIIAIAGRSSVLVEKKYADDLTTWMFARLTPPTVKP